MDTPRIAELLRPFFDGRDALTPLQLDQISMYIDLLIRWKSRVNLTAIRAPEEIVTRHFGESLFAARHLLPHGPTSPSRSPTSSAAEVRDTVSDSGTIPQVRVRSLDANLGDSHPDAPGTVVRLVDIGSGAGFPGLPIKIWSPRTQVTLIESNNKKVAFLREAIRALTLIGIDVYPGRAEDFPAASAHAVTLRAVERFDHVLPTATRLLAPSGRLALLITRPQLPMAQATVPTLQWETSPPVPLSTNRIVAIGTVPGTR
ncbi:MAG TPA: 16S rRNA (guanine(527)-N(7))-methyltransferase RsmG [Terriglobales bacterium]|nr:16S rRNA (guanine(527)-N(7))-methyltransferase RsmG [Terriglobales bacterium]